MYILKYLLVSSIVVKGVMLLLLVLSILIWAAFFSKINRLSLMTNYINTFEQAFWSGISLEDFYNGNKGNLSHPLGIIFSNVMEEWKSSKKTGYTKQTLMERISNSSEGARVEIRKVIEKYQSFFLTVTSMSPLLGLFGTVCGIITTFHALDLNGNANIAAIAPGVAEALITTAFSIFVAVCAAGIYNFFNAKISLLEDKIDIFNIDLMNLISRELDSNGLEEKSNPEPIITQNEIKTESNSNPKTDDTSSQTKKSFDDGLEDVLDDI